MCSILNNYIVQGSEWNIFPSFDSVGITQELREWYSYGELLEKFEEASLTNRELIYNSDNRTSPVGALLFRSTFYVEEGKLKLVFNFPLRRDYYVFFWKI